MNKSKKIYIKALDKYNNGYIDKAIDLCEESISIDIKNAASINLKGLLCYLKGDLDSAQRLWKMNKQTNRDAISEKYLEDTKEDVERLKLYQISLDFIKELRIQEAINLLKKCAQSDFNYINVNNQLALCYMKKAEYDKVLEYINKVFQVDKYNTIANDIRKSLESCGMIKEKIVLKKATYILVVFCLIAVIASSLFVIRMIKSKQYLSIIDKFKLESTDSNRDAKKQVNPVVVETSKNSREANNKTKTVAFPNDKIKVNIENKDFEAIYDEVLRWKDKSLGVNDKVILSNAEEMIKTEGVDYFYSKGYSYMSSKDYLNAKVYFLKAYEVGKSHYLYPHIVYMLGTTCHLLGDDENTIKYYTQYDQASPDGEYEETVLYTLAIIYKDVNRSAAKNYAEKLIATYPSSIYNNSIIGELVNN